MKLKHLLLELIMAVERNHNCTDDELKESFDEVVKYWEIIKPMMKQYNEKDRTSITNDVVGLRRCLRCEKLVSKNKGWIDKDGWKYCKRGCKG